MTDRDPEPLAGAIVAHKYRLLEAIGSGGMGSVWAAEHVGLRTRYAIKFMERALLTQPGVRQRFDNEARAAASLQSRYIVKVFDYGVDEETGRPYLVMELLKGQSLAARLEEEGTLPFDETVELAGDVARALQRAHGAGIVHRDLKPENVLLVRDEDEGREYAKLVDFGVAKFHASTGLASVTETGAVLGTPQYMSPEQARGLRDVDGRADVWSLGVLVYRCLTGRLPFDGDAIGDLLVKICTQEPLAPSAHVPLPAAVDRWMAQSLAKTPAERFADVQTQAAALVACLPRDASPAAGGDAEIGQKRSRRGPIALAGIVVVLAASLLWLRARRDVEEPLPVAPEMVSRATAAPPSSPLSVARPEATGPGSPSGVAPAPPAARDAGLGAERPKASPARDRIGPAGLSRKDRRAPVAPARPRRPSAQEELGY